MSLTGNNILGGASGQPVPYDVPYSIKTVNGDRISRTMTATGAATPYFTYSTWFKKSDPATNQFFLWWQAKAIHANAVVELANNASSVWRFNLWTGSSSEADRYSTEKYRDPAAWTHWVVQWNGATFAMYMNNELVDMSTSGNINGNSWGLQSGDIMRIASSDAATSTLGYTAETYFIEGQTLAPSNFAELNEDTGQWVPKEYEGTFSGNSFYLDYADSSDLGKDVSGLDNHFTVSGGIDANSQVLDSPTNNFATLNPLWNKAGGYSFTLSEGNLKNTVGTGGQTIPSTFIAAPLDQKWYWEWYGISGGANKGIGVILNLEAATSYENQSAYQWKWEGTNGIMYNTGGSGSYTLANSTLLETGDVGAIFIDGADIKFYKNGSLTYTATNAITAANSNCIIPSSGGYHDNNVYAMNFGQDSSFAGEKTSGSANASDANGIGDFYHTPPTGALACCTANLSDPSIADPTKHFNTVLWSGSSSAQAITGVGFAPTAVWTKRRNSTGSHYLWDQVRGNAERLEINSTGAEETQSGQWTSFDSDGFTLGGGSDATNNTGGTYVAWNWKAGGSAVSNSDGSITSSVSANPTAGFSIVGYTGTGSTATVGHGLSVAPEFLIVKNRTTGSTAWQCGSDYLPHATPWSRYITLSSDAAETNSTQMWNDTAPTSSVFTIKDAGDVNTNTNNYIAYCFHSVEGYSKVGSYTGNGATDGPFIYTGFRPAFIMVKLTTASSGQWVMFDNKRDPDNPTDRVFYANLNAISTDVSSYHPYDILSNGFKSRIPAGNGNEASYNSSGETYIYLAFAESPFKYSNAR